jgi:hypothetical protein
VAERLPAAGIATAHGSGEAAWRYVSLRRRWQCFVTAFADHMQRSLEESTRAAAGGAVRGQATAYGSGGAESAPA